MKKVIKKLNISQMIVLGFLTVLLIGGFLLMLPISSNTQTFTNFWDAFFTATSALCVTGQVTLNTAEHWSLFGKTVIMILIEVGGLGFMSILVVFFFMMGKKLNLKQKLVIQESLNLDEISETKTLVRYVVMFSLTIQSIGALLLSIDFIPRLGLLKGIYYSIFHSISAFCNAGFDLFGDSLIGFQENPFVLIVVMLLIFIGGLGFIVWRDLFTYRKDGKLLFHTKVVLMMSAIVMSTAFILFSFSETQNETFAHLSPFHRIVNTMFLVVTPRTAGFSNIDYRMISIAGLFLTFVLMFVGGSSGSTSGGFKITTLFVLFTFLTASLRNEEPHFKNRSIGKDRIEKTIALLIIGVSLITVITFLLLLTQPSMSLDSILMEVFSCFGTVGLSMGVTPLLNSFGKLLLMILMFMGRVGTLTVILSLSHHDKKSKIHYPEGKILIG